jgi:hypothetical protein
MQKFDMERFSLKKLNEVEGKEQYQVEITNRFAALENNDDYVDINIAWETVRGGNVARVRRYFYTCPLDYAK